MTRDSSPFDIPDDLVVLPVAVERRGALDTGTVVAAEIQAEVAAPLLVAFEAESCHFAGRGAAALCALAQSLEEQGAEIIMPTLVCPSVPLACMLGGLVPVFADVLESDYTLDPAHVAALIGPRTVAILAVHLYGHPCAIATLRALADHHGLLLIEDCAQSLGQLDDDRFVGTSGDATILSFHPSKILPAAGGGAVLLQRGGAHLAERITQNIAAFPEECALGEPEVEDLGRRGNAILNAARLEPSYASRYRSLIGGLGQAIPYQVSVAHLEGIRREWQYLDQAVVQRTLRAERYEALLTEPMLRHPSLSPGVQPLFRYTLRPDLEPEAAVRCTHHLTSTLREQGFHASNLYFPVHALLGDSQHLPVAERVGRSLLNLWLDGTATADAMLRIRRVVEHVLHRTNYLAPPLGLG